MRYTSRSEGLEGGALFDFDGKFVGVNVILAEEKTFFIPWRIIIKQLECIWSSLLNQECVLQPKISKEARPSVVLSNCHRQTIKLYEEQFGDVFDQGTWRELGTKVSSEIQRNVVALASFHGETSFFACTVFVIKWNRSTIILTSASLVRSSGYGNNIEENLRIEVCTDEGRTQGMLQHYSLHYNVALISVKDCCPLPPAKVRLELCRTRRYKAAAVGRCFKSGNLMAKNGYLVPWTGTFDCKFLARVSCKISKIGIGGPLVTFDGDVIGMNFYDNRAGTPYLSWKTIQKILAHFSDTVTSPSVEGSGATYWKLAGDSSHRPNRWPVRGWRPCDYSSGDESGDKDYGSEDELPSCSVWRYTYIQMEGEGNYCESIAPEQYHVDLAMCNAGEAVPDLFWIRSC